MMTNNKYSLAKIASYITGGSMAICANLSPILFITFKDLYNISYTLLGFIVVINFLTQLVIDLAFSFFTKYFNIHKCVRMTPLIVFIGLLLYGIMPMLFPKMAYLWIIISTIIFSVAFITNAIVYQQFFCSNIQFLCNLRYVLALRFPICFNNDKIFRF